MTAPAGRCAANSGLAGICTSPTSAAHADLATSCLQMNVLQANEESSGPFAFQFLHLAKLRAAPQARLISAVLSFIEQDAAFVSGSPVCTTHVQQDCRTFMSVAPEQVVYASAKCDIALLDSLRNCTEQGTPSSSDVRMEKSRLFSYDAALRCLQLLHVTGMPQDLDVHEHTSW